MSKDVATVHDPFLGKDVEISSRLTDRLRGKYACGPTLPNGEPEFGWRQHPLIPIQVEAAERIEQQAAEIADLRQALAELGVTPEEARAGAARSRARTAEIERLKKALREIGARTYSSDRSCKLKADAVAEIFDIANAATMKGGADNG